MSTAILSPFCIEHPRGTMTRCGACASARRSWQALVAGDGKRRVSVNPERDMATVLQAEPATDRSTKLRSSIEVRLDVDSPACVIVLVGEFERGSVVVNSRSHNSSPSGSGQVLGTPDSPIRTVGDSADRLSPSGGLAEPGRGSEDSGSRTTNVRLPGLTRPAGSSPEVDPAGDQS